MTASRPGSGRRSIPGPDGRQLLDVGFPDDDGSADPAVTAALAAYDAAPGGQDAYAGALLAVQDSRLLVPVVAMLGEVEVGEDGLARDKSADMAVVLMTGRDGRRALLGFTSMASMHAWQPDARPVPVAAPLAARSALDEGAQALVLDVAGPVLLPVERGDLERWAAGQRLVRLEDGAYAWTAPAAAEDSM
ncbi:SseB family protein [Nocardioidaceae bacterium]|nr:SseB family protein [Nocardioidaceae bacterium]